MKVRNVDIGVRINETQYYRAYLGMFDGSQPVIVKVSKSLEYDELWLNEADWFIKMDTFAKELKKDTGKKQETDYAKFFAKLESSFLEPNQDGRRINVFSVPGLELTKLIPLSELRGKISVDPGTSAWIMKNLLEFYRFFELQPKWDIPLVEYPVFSPDDYLIEPRKQRLIYFNYSGKNLEMTADGCIKNIALFIQDWCGTKVEMYEAGGGRSKWAWKWNEKKEEKKGIEKELYETAKEDIAYLELLRSIVEWRHLGACDEALKELYNRSNKAWLSGEYQFAYSRHKDSTTYFSID